MGGAAAATRGKISPFPAQLIVDATSIRTENASRSLYEGRLVLSDFKPIAKNPNVACFAYSPRTSRPAASVTSSLYEWMPILP